MTRLIVALYLCGAAVCPKASVYASVLQSTSSTFQHPQRLVDDVGGSGIDLLRSTFPNSGIIASSITLDEAIQLALEHYPPLQADRLEVLSAQAGIRQARLVPNPDLSIEMDQIGRGPKSAFNADEKFWGVSQQIEIGGKRTRRIALAKDGKNAAESELAAITLTVVQDVSTRFYDLLAKQRRLELSDSLLSTAEQFYATVSQRQQAGKVSEVEARRARILLSGAQVQHQEARRMVNSAQIALQSMWGEAVRPIDKAKGSLDQVVSIPPLDWMMSRLDEHPDLRTLRIKGQEAQSRHALEQSKAIPDLELNFGVRRYRDLGSEGITVGVRIALPFFDRNQGAIARSSMEVAQSAIWLESAKLQMMSQIRVGYSDVIAAQSEAEFLGESAIADAMANLEAIVIGYEDGKYDLLSVLDAQRVLFEISDLHINALEQFHTRRLHIERLIGVPFSFFQAEETRND